MGEERRVDVGGGREEIGIGDSESFTGDCRFTRIYRFGGWGRFQFGRFGVVVTASVQQG